MHKNSLVDLLSLTVEKRTVWTRTIIETNTPSELVGADGDVVRIGVSTTCPPSTLLGLSGGFGITTTSAIKRGSEIGDVVTFQLLQPFLNLG